MPTFYVDETGFTGEDLLAEDQPIFAQATNDFSDAEAAHIIKTIFGGVKADELKHKGLYRKPACQDRIVELIRLAVADPKRVATWVTHKEFAMVTFVVDWWIEPLALQTGLNLYKDGGNQSMSNMFFICLQGFWDEKFRRKILLAFQRMFRARSQDRFDECRDLVEKSLWVVRFDEKRFRTLDFLWPPFELLGMKHVLRLPEHALDVAFSGLVTIAHHWRAQQEGPWGLIHDRSSNMAKQKWLWDDLTSAGLPPRRFEGPHGPSIYPMNIASTQFADSVDHKQIQLCDLIAGATSASLRLPEGDPYRQKLHEAGILDLAIDGLWPSDAVTPEELGRKGLDGNEAIEWLMDVMPAKRAAHA